MSEPAGSGPAARWDAELARLASPSPSPLLQSWAWGEVQRQEGWEVERVELDGAMASVQLQGRGPLRRAYVPRGPVPATRAALEALAAWAAGKGLASLRVEPDAGPELGGELRELGFRPARAREPRHTLIVPLAAPEAMLASFKNKHRYNIRLAEKRGVTVEETGDAAEMERQAVATAARQGIVQARAPYYERRLRLLPWCRIYVARHEGEALAATLVIRHDGRAYYMYGGSNQVKSNLMPTYAVQWAAMRSAAADGLSEYDLWGLPPDGDPSHPWAGLWQFKTGFGGTRVEYAGAWELVLSEPGHRLAGAVEGLRRVASAARRRAGRGGDRPARG